MDVQVTGDGALWLLDKLSAAKKAPQKAPPAQKVSPEEKRKELRGKQQTEIELWKTWKDAPSKQKPQALDPLLKSFQPLLQSHLNQYRGRAEVPTSAIDHVHKKLLVDALRTWDPKGGAALGSWVTKHLQKGSRFVNDHKNMVRSSENIWSKIGDYNSVKANLTEKLGHEPSDQDIHDHVLKIKHPKLGVLSLKDIKRLGREQRKSLIASPELDKDHLLGGNFSSRDEQLILMIHPELSKEERAVHEYVFGKYFDKPTITSTSKLAKKLGFSDSKVSKLKTSIFKKMEPYRTE